MNIISGVATGLVNLLAPPFLLRLGYLLHYKRNIKELKIQMEDLVTVRTDVQRSVEVDEERGRVIKEEVKNWLAKVDATEREVSRLHEELEANKGCLACNVHYRVGKTSKIKIDEVKNLRSEGRFDVVSIPPPPPPAIEFEDTHDFQHYAPTKSAMRQIVEALEDKKLNLIGVYGMGGVGKTTLVLETAKQLKKKGVFDRVVVATVSQKCILTEIQREIAEKLCLELKEKNEAARASRLLEKLKKEKRILIVLDDLWERVELTEVGIPYIPRDGLDGKGNNGDGRECRCSIIITTRSQEVCNQMGTQSIVEVKVLPKADAWHLFRRSAGGCVDSQELYFVAGEVVGGCGGLPVAIVTIGRSLRDKDLQIWQHAAFQLKVSTLSPSTIPGMEERVFSSIRLSYDYLISKEAKLCFLLCCLFPEDHVIEEDELFPFVWGEEVFEGIETLREARDRLHTVLDMLKRSCLLLNVEDRSGVKMHDIVRDVTIWIASQEEHGFVVKARRGLDQLPDLKKMRSKRLSLMENRISRLPERITGCPQLTTLSLRKQKYPGLQDIPGECFEGMKSLKVLDLNFNWVYSIPSSAFSWFKELRVLLLHGTGVEDISSFGNMKNLEILSLLDCNIETLPQEMISWGGMTNLKSLNLKGNRRLSIPSGVVSRLSRLEELHLLFSFKGWEADEEEEEEEEEEEDGPINTGGGGAARLSELASLRCLSMLEIEVPNIQLLININSGALPLVSNLSRFSIWLGERPNKFWSQFFLHERNSNGGNGMVCYDITLPVPNEWVGKLLERTEQLHIHNCRGAAPGKSIYPGYFIGESGGGKSNGLNNLRFLDVVGVSDVEYFLSSSSSSSSVDRVEQVVPFKRLEKLKLFNLEHLKKIYHGHGHGRPSPSLKGGLENLRVLRIVKCDALNPILPLNIARGLLRLEHLDISSNTSAEEIISLQEEEEEEEEDGAANDDNEQEEHKKSLNTTTGEMMMMMMMMMVLVPLPNLKTLDIDECHRLKHICPMSVVAADQGFFSQLEALRITDCSSFEELFADTTTSSNAEHGASESSNNSVPVFPRLRELRLSRLPNFSAICRGVVSAFGNYSFPVCEELYIKGCPKLKRLPLSLESSPRLRSMLVEERWFNQLEWNDPSEKQLLLQGGKVEFFSKDETS